MILPSKPWWPMNVSSGEKKNLLHCYSHSSSNVHMQVLLPTHFSAGWLGHTSGYQKTGS